MSERDPSSDAVSQWGALDAARGLEPRQVQACIWDAADGLSNYAIAERLGVHPTTVLRWTYRPEYQRLAKEIHAATHADVLRMAVARKAQRVIRLQQRWIQLQRITDDRGQWFSENRPEVAGGATGLLVERLKVVGSGPHARTEPEYEVDEALLRAERDIAKMAAQELGQWSEKVDITADVEHHGPPTIVRFREQELREPEPEPVEAEFEELGIPVEGWQPGLSPGEQAALIEAAKRRMESDEG